MVSKRDAADHAYDRIKGCANATARKYVKSAEIYEKLLELRELMTDEELVLYGDPTSPAPQGVIEVQLNSDDEVNHPAHYNQGPIECIDAIESIGIGFDFCLGNAIKYLWRLKHAQNPLQDCQKALWYVQRLLKIMEER